MVIAENKLFDSLKKLGVDIEGTLSRFVDDDVIYTKFLARFPDEDRITPIREALHSGDNNALLSAAHNELPFPESGKNRFQTQKRHFHRL